MSKLKKLLAECPDWGPTYSGRLYEKLAFKLSKSQGEEISVYKTLVDLSDETNFSDDGYLSLIIDTYLKVDSSDDEKFTLKRVAKTNNYTLKVNGEFLDTIDSMDSSLTKVIEDYFMEDVSPFLRGTYYGEMQLSLEKDYAEHYSEYFDEEYDSMFLDDDCPY
jgi:hypothetical protein